MKKTLTDDQRDELADVLFHLTGEDYYYAHPGGIELDEESEAEEANVIWCDGTPVTDEEAIAILVEISPYIIRAAHLLAAIA